MFEFSSRRSKRLPALLVLCVALGFVATTLAPAVGAQDPPRPIPDWYGNSLVPDFKGGAQTPNPVPGTAPPQHPFMADNGANTMQSDSYSSGTHPETGPLGTDPQIRSAATAPIGGMCAAFAFDSKGRVVTVCASFSNFMIRLLDPDTLTTLAKMRLPQRPSTIEALLTLDLQKIFTDTSGGAYFFLDHEDRAVLVDAEQTLRVIGIDDSTPSPALFDVARYSLADELERDCFAFPDNLHPRGVCDVVTAALPDWDGYYWWVSRYGVVGTTHPETGVTETLRLEGEEIQNSFSIDDRGIYLVSDHAMYGMRRGADGTPEIVWREEYERATAPRPGQINLGSGTSPTLIADDLVAIGDGADPVNVVFMNRDFDHTFARTLCTHPVFDKGRSATDNSFIGFGNSVVVENNYGYLNFTSLVFGRVTVGGLARVDIDRATNDCRTVWNSAERSPSMLQKLSRGAGLVYAYTKDRQPFGIDAWYFTAIDFATGETVYKKLTGTGWGYDSNWGTAAVGPDGTAYVGVFNGLISVRDSGAL